MERAGSRDYGQLDTKGGSAGKAARKSRWPKDNQGDAVDTKHLRLVVGHHTDFFPPPESHLSPIWFSNLPFFSITDTFWRQM